MLDATIRADLERLAEGEDEATRFTAREVLLDAEEANLHRIAELTVTKSKDN